MYVEIKLVEGASLVRYLIREEFDPKGIRVTFPKLKTGRYTPDGKAAIVLTGFEFRPTVEPKGVRRGGGNAR